MHHRARWFHNEEGVVLVLCLVTLGMLTLLGVSSTSTSQLEVEIAGNDKTYKEALYAAEMALNAGEATINSVLTRPELGDGTKPGRYVKNTQPVWDLLVWDSAHSAEVTSIPNSFHVAAPPRYTIEERAFWPNDLVIGHGVTTGSYRFLVRSQGTGANKDAHVLLESIYAKRYN